MNAYPHHASQPEVAPVLPPSPASSPSPLNGPGAPQTPRDTEATAQAQPVQPQPPADAQHDALTPEVILILIAAGALHVVVAVITRLIHGGIR